MLGRVGHVHVLANLCVGVEDVVDRESGLGAASNLVSQVVMKVPENTNGMLIPDRGAGAWVLAG